MDINSFFLINCKHLSCSGRFYYYRRLSDYKLSTIRKKNSMLIRGNQNSKVNKLKVSSQIQVLSYNQDFLNSQVYPRDFE